MPSLLAMTNRQTTQKTIMSNELLADRFHRLAFSRRARVERRLEHPLSLKQYIHTLNLGLFLCMFGFIRESMC